MAEEEELVTEAEGEGEEEEEEEDGGGDTSDSTSSTGKTLAQTLRLNEKVPEHTRALETMDGREPLVFDREHFEL